jgi:PAS domain S-box-containing protein
MEVTLLSISYCLLVLWSGAFITGILLGYTVEEMMGKSLFSFMDAKAVEVAKKKMEERREAETFEFEFLKKDGTYVLTSISTNPTTDKHGNFTGGLALVTDITERRRMEKELVEYAERMRRLESDVAASVLDWLITPTGIIKVHGSLMEKEIKKLEKEGKTVPDAIKSSIQMIQKNVTRLLERIKQLEKEPQ